jgi:hypothetical protein
VQETPEQSTRKYIRIGGWLLIFCSLLIFAVPLTCIATHMYYVRSFSGVQNAGGFLGAHALVMVLVSGFSMYAGVMLWRLHPRALVVARAYLVTALIVGVFSPLLLLLGPLGAHTSLSPEAQGEFIGSASGRALAPNLAVFFIWWTYLKKSRRVRETFPQTEPRK